MIDRRLFIGLIFALVPTAVGAQYVQGSPMQPSARAQTDVMPTGITITASGSASAAADAALITLHLSGRTITSSTLGVIRAAMVQAGMDADSVQIPPYMQYPQTQTQFISMSGTVQHPDRAKMMAAIPIIGMAFAREQLGLPNAEIIFSINDCSQLLAIAQRNALIAARAEAARLAQTAGVKLGGIEGITVNTASYMNAGVCQTFTSLPVGGGQQQDPTKDMNVHVTTYATVRFTISH